MPSAVPPRALLRALAAAATALAVGAQAAQAADPVAATVDRTTGVTDPPAAMERAQERLRSNLGARALVEPDPTAGTPRIVARLDGFLTQPSPRDPQAIALDYVRDHAAAFGLDGADLATLRLTSRRRGPDTVYLVWEQQVDDVPNVDGGLQAAVRDDGRLINVRGGPLPDPQASAPTPRISAGEAFEAAVPGDKPAPPTGTARGADQRTPFLGGGEASLVLYRDAGADRLGWRVLYAASSDAFYDAIVDARTGVLQRRVNRTHSAEQINHFDVSPRAAGDTSPTLSTIPNGWLGGERRLKGPYVHAVSDVDDRIWLTTGANGYEVSAEPEPADEVEPTSPVGEDRVWGYDPLLGGPAPKEPSFCGLCSWDDSPINTTANREFSTAQLFWYVNTFRNHLAAPPIGFTGVGEFKDGDAVLAQALDGACSTAVPPPPRPHPCSVPDGPHLSNANMTVLPDGFAGLMQMYLFGLTSAAHYDGAMDASIVYHEYTHGLSERLVTDGQGFGALSGPQPGAISEGTSDFYAMDYLVETEPTAMDDDPARQGDVRMGRWMHSNSSPILKSANAIRTEGIDCFPQPVDSTRCGGPTPATPAGTGGYTYDDFGKIDGAPEVHADGEIWGQTLWSLRKALIDARGAAEGLLRTRAYVTEGLRLSPPYPTFLDMRNAILQAAVTLHGDQDWDTIWAVFAARGMGWSAETSGADDTTPTAASDGPPAAGTGDASAIGQTGATVAGVIDPRGVATDYRFEFGETTLLGAQTAPQPAGSAGAVAVSAALTGLRPGMTYHYRVAAVRGTHALPGAIRSFTTAAPTPTPTPTPTPPPPRATATAFDVTKLSASRKGLFKVRVRFGSAAPAGKARLRVLLRRTRLAEGRLAVRPGRTSTKTLTLNSAGRRKVKPGRSRKVTLELRLPDGKKVKKTLTLARRKR